MPAGAFVTPLAGASITQVWKPAPGVTAGSAAADGAAPFALGTRGIIVPPATTNRTLAQFCRVGASGIAAAGTTGIGTDGVTASTGTWTNDTGVALVTGDYVFLTSGLTLALADEGEFSSFAGADSARVWKLESDAEPPFPLDAISVMPDGTKLGKFTRVAGDLAPGAMVGEWKNDTGVALVDGDHVWLTKPIRSDDEAAAMAAEEAEYQKAEKGRIKTKASTY